MPKAPRDKDSATPKKRTRKTAAATDNGAHAANGNGTSAQSVTAASEVTRETAASSNIEEKIRARAYELYLQRGGIDGSPEEDWLRAQEEIRGRAATA